MITHQLGITSVYTPVNIRGSVRRAFPQPVFGNQPKVPTSPERRAFLKHALLMLGGLFLFPRTLFAQDKFGWEGNTLKFNDKYISNLYYMDYKHQQKEIKKLKETLGDALQINGKDPISKKTEDRISFYLDNFFAGNVINEILYVPENTIYRKYNLYCHPSFTQVDVKRMGTVEQVPVSYMARPDCSSCIKA